MTEMKDLVSLYFERGNAMQTLWGLYITITLGLLAFFGAAKVSAKRYVLAAILSIGFAGFAAVNQDALHDVTCARNAIRKIILDKEATTTEDKALQYLVSKIAPPTSTQVRVFHIAADVSVLIALWTITLLKQREPAASS